MKKIDAINKQILAILQDNGSITNSDLAAQIGLSPATTLERVKKLKKEGIIRKTVALVNPEMVDQNILAWVEISMLDHSSQASKMVRDAIKNISSVLECYHIAGEQDFLMKVVTKDIKTYREIAAEQIAKIPNIGKINSKFVLYIVKEETQIPIS